MSRASTSPSYSARSQRIGERIRAGRARLHVSRPRLAEMTGGAITASQLDHWECGRARPTLEDAEALADVIGPPYSAAYLLTLETQP